MTNFDSDRVIILYYHPGAGGKFLGNSLALSSDCVMMNSRLAKMQLDGKLSQKQKLSILLTAIERSGNSWNDLGFTDKNWFGIDYESMKEKYGVDSVFDLDQDQFKSMVYTDELFQYVTSNNTKYFSKSAMVIELKKKLSIWKNAKILSLKNEKLFKTIRRYENPWDDQLKLKSIWSLMPKEERGDWKEPISPTERNPNPGNINIIPENVRSTLLYHLNDSEFMRRVVEHMQPKYSVSVPKLYSEYKNISEEVKYILENENTSEEYAHPDSIFVWDCNWYLSEQNTIHNIKCLYDVLELEGYDEQSIRSYYRSWIKKLEELI